MKGYYDLPDVRARMAEFLGSAPVEDGTAVYVTGKPGVPGAPDTTPVPSARVGTILDRNHEVARSLWDRHQLVVDLDIEYVNFDFPAEAYLEPGRSFGLQRPVVRAVRALLARWGIEPLHVLSGRGHHFFWAVPRHSDAFDRLVEMGPLPPSLAGRYRAPHPPSGAAVDEALGRAWAGLGLVMEYLGHRLRETAGPESAIPVELGDLEPEWATRGREVVAIDLSEYGDPLPSRFVTIPFSRYLKPLRDRPRLGDHAVRRLPGIFTIPDPGVSEGEAIRLMREEAGAAEVARRIRSRIPSAPANGGSPPAGEAQSDESPAGMSALVEEYAGSPLADFHRHFYGAEHDPPEIWHRTYDRTPLHPLSPPARAALARPNDLLLKPRMILEVVRELVGAGWHPRHIAGLIRSRYERPYGWGERWYRDDATARADHYVRLFSGMLALGRSPGTPPWPTGP